MQPVKLLGVVLVVTSSLAAVVGVGTAAAVTELEKVVWCKERNNQCPQNADFPSGTNILAKSTSTEILTQIGVITCETGDMSLNTSSLLAHGELINMTFENCTRELLEECEISPENIHYLFRGELQANHVGYEMLVSQGAGGGPPKLHVVCSAGLLNCRLTANSVLFEALLTLPTEKLKVLQTLAVEGGPLCGALNGSVWHDEFGAECEEGAEEKPCWIKMET